jgi:hypothetical protein
MKQSKVKSIQKILSNNSIEWLKANIDIWERHQVGNHKYLNDSEKKRLQAIAKEIDKDRYFTLYGCDKCIQELIRFVFKQYDNDTRTV